MKEDIEKELEDLSIDFSQDLGTELSELINKKVKKPNLTKRKRGKQKVKK